jgi:hypothetical protein
MKKTLSGKEAVRAIDVIGDDAATVARRDLLRPGAAN